MISPTLRSSNMAMESPLRMKVLIGKSPITGPFASFAIAMFDYRKGRGQFSQNQWAHCRSWQCLGPDT